MRGRFIGAREGRTWPGGGRISLRHGRGERDGGTGIRKPNPALSTSVARRRCGVGRAALNHPTFVLVLRSCCCRIHKIMNEKPKAGLAASLDYFFS